MTENKFFHCFHKVLVKWKCPTLQMISFILFYELKKKLNLEKYTKGLFHPKATCRQSLEETEIDKVLTQLCFLNILWDSRHCQISFLHTDTFTNYSNKKE